MYFNFIYFQNNGGDDGKEPSVGEVQVHLYIDLYLLCDCLLEFID